MKHPWALLLCALSLSACPNSPEARPAPLVLLVDAEADLRAELDRVEVHTTRASAVLPVPNGQADHGWPLSIGVAPGSTANGVLEVKAFAGGQEVVRRTVDLTLDPTMTPRALSVFLTSSCRGVFTSCDELGGGTCLPCQSSCVPAQLDGSMLPALVKGEPVASAWVMPMCVAKQPDGDLEDTSTDSDNMDGSMDVDADASHDASAVDASADAALADAATDAGTPRDPSTLFRPIAVSRTHLCAIQGSERGVWCLGGNRSGQLGVAKGTEPADWKTPVRVGGGTPLEGAVQVGVGWNYSCALLEDARVYCWGAREYYQTGTRNRGLDYLPYPVVKADVGAAPAEYEPLENIVQLSAGLAHACALNAEGQVFCWGSNHDQQLGIDSSADAISGATRVTIPSASPVRLLSRGGASQCAVTDAEEVFCWGSNQHGQAGVTPRSDGKEPLVLNIPTPTRLPLEAEAVPVVDIAGSNAHMALLAENHSVWTWGSNFFLQLDRDAPICDDPKMTPYGCSGVPGQATSFGGAGVELAVMGASTCIVDKPDRQVWCRGERVGASLTNVTTITGDGIDNLGCAITADEDVYCWGSLDLEGAQFAAAPDVALVAFPSAE